MLQELSGYVFAVAFPLSAFLVVLYLYSVWKFERFLESSNKSVWEKLGSPNLISNNSIRNNSIFIKFVKNPTAIEVSLDENVINKAKNIYKLYVSIAGVFLLWFVSLLGIMLFDM